MLAPGSTVCKISTTTSVIEEPNRQEVKVQNSDVTKFGTKAERDTDPDHSPDLTQISHFNPAVPNAPPPHSPNVAGPSAARVASSQMPTPILRKTEDDN